MDLRILEGEANREITLQNARAPVNTKAEPGPGHAQSAPPAPDPLPAAEASPAEPDPRPLSLQAALEEATAAFAKHRDRLWLIAYPGGRLQRCKDEAGAGLLDETGAALFPFASSLPGGYVEIEKQGYSLALITLGAERAEVMTRFNEFACRAGALEV
jgi:hypothetical protein